MPRGRPKKSRNDNVLFKSAELLGWALGGIEREIAHTRERLATLSAQATKLRARVGAGRASGRGAAAAPSFAEPAVMGRKARRRRMSPEARKRISEMMKKRWAERKKKKL
jgi:hypothetical protein